MEQSSINTVAARRAILGLVHHEVRVVEVERDLDLPRACERVLERRRDVEVQHVTELVGLASPVGLDARGEVRRIMGSEARLA